MQDQKKPIFEKKNIIVTGGAGFIGSHLCDELIRNAKVICIDNFKTGELRNIEHLLSNPDFVFLRHNINDPINLESIPDLEKFKIEFQGIQEIYNLACPMSPKDFEDNRISTLLSNSIGVKNLLDLALKYKSKFMQFSSSVVYGPRRKENPNVKEDDLGVVDFLSYRSAYDEGKRFAETITQNYRDIYGLNTKIIRLFRIYGPRMKLNDNQMIPDFINDALDNKNLLILGDENFCSSFCYISDCIDAVIRLMKLDNITEPINIGSNQDINITELANKIITICNTQSKIIYSDPDKFMTPLCLPDIRKAKKILAWMPIVTLEKGLQLTIDYLYANKGLRTYEDFLDKNQE